mmetsp:Transcript_26429/g.78478  ORF Transcript_26429/g.78478 Transcript_26429/m.78478 type:complete len:574 (-) Transcript_26429:3178-4899(-)
MSTAGSGGFIARAERSTLDVRVSTEVGPGAYELAGSHDVYPAPVPFLTSGEKNLLENNTTSAITPGVGAYNADVALDALMKKRTAPAGPTASFATGGPRLADDKSHIFVPGPGAYSANGSSSWIKKRWNGPQPAQRNLPSKPPNVPSIPARDQSYGYEESGTGTMVMQQSPEVITTGRGTDRIGPGQYDVQLGVIGRTSKAPGWAASRAKRGQDYMTAAPGPGAYDPSRPAGKSASGPIVVNVGGVEVQFGGASGTSTFVSKVPLASQRQSTAQIPGPGSYNDPRELGSKAIPLPPGLQCFSSTSRRSSAIDPTNSLSAPTCFKTPGPGAYEDPRRSINVASSSFAEPQPFNTSASRFSQGDKSVPGPGQYNADQVDTVAKFVAAKAAASKAGVFGSVAVRFPAGEEADRANKPGPGSYEPKVTQSPPRHRGGAMAFTSKTDRFRASTAPSAGSATKSTDNGLGPGSYALDDPWSKSRGVSYKQTAFGSDAQRSNALSGAAWTPGPGRYKQDVDIKSIYRPVTMPARDTVFGSSTSRFKGPSNSSPGPGQYQVTKDLVRKSYNVTYTMGEPVM